MATGKIMKLPDPETIPNAIALTSFQNNWQGNGLSFYQVLGNVVHLHCSIRNGTTTSGIAILTMPQDLTPSVASLASAINLNDKAIVGYATANTNRNITLNVSSNSSIVFDLYYTI